MTDDTGNLVLEQLRAIRAELAEHTARFARIETTLAHMDESLRGLSRITIGLVGAVDNVRDRLRVLEEQSKA